MSLTGDWRGADNNDNTGRAFSRSDEEFSLELGGSVHRINNNMQQGIVHKVCDCNFAKMFGHKIRDKGDGHRE